jgi:Predicted membrane protein (DUF2243)
MNTLDGTGFPLSAGVLFGLGLGGFFDGIALHRVLQWHHMLTQAGYPATSLENLENNTFWVASKPIRSRSSSRRAAKPAPPESGAPATTRSRSACGTAPFGRWDQPNPARRTKKNARLLLHPIY